MNAMMPLNMMSIDVEDYFHVSAFEGVSPPCSWSERECRVENNTELLLSVLNDNETSATFFVLGWVAERFPTLVKRIAAEGHEIASHGFGHQRINKLSREAFRADIRKSKYLLESLTGQQVVGYRAPSYSISSETFWAFDELFEAGYQYDSSVFPIKHDFYGLPDWPRFPGTIVRNDDGSWQPSETATTEGASLYEIPITTLSFADQKVPIAGGGYFRFYPYNFTHWGLKRINILEEQPFIFYLHPWELDHEQPRMHGAGLKSNFRHYLNLRRTENRFRELLQDFNFSSIREVRKANSSVH